MSTVNGPSRWAAATGGTRGPGYAAQFARLAAQGVDVHGEATFCASLITPGSRILDAGCGTGRVAIRLAEQGYACTGIDNDASMLAVARDTSQDVTWILADLLELPRLVDAGQRLVDAGEVDARPLDLAVAAGNVIPLLAPGTERLIISFIGDLLAPGGLLVAGFGLDRAHLPLADVPFGLSDYDAWCADAGLSLVRRHATWDGDPYNGGGYAVSVHRRG